MLVIEGRVYQRGLLRPLCIGIEEGKIARVEKTLKGDEHIDFGNRIILPAAIDLHVHFREPGFTHKEDFSTGTLAAAFGGVSCAVDMPNTNPPTVSLIDLQKKATIAAKKAYIDFGLNVALESQTDIMSTARQATGFKLYMSPSTAAGSISCDDPAIIRRMTSQASSAGTHICAHCEDERLFKKGAPANLEQFLAQRPSESESKQVETLISLCPPDSRTHICHVSAEPTISLLRTIKKSRSSISCEVTPHHLFITAKSTLGSLGKVNPPLRRDSDREILWQALRDGTIDIIASDHAPHTLKEKKEFRTAPSGMPGVETMLPLMLLQSKRGNLDLARLVNAISEKPATLLGLNKGSLEPGLDADITVVDTRKIRKITADTLHSKCGWTPFEGMEAIFPECLMIRGEFVIRDFDLVGKKGYGRYSRCASKPQDRKDERGVQ